MFAIKIKVLYLQQQNKKQPDKADTLKLKNKTL